MITFGTPLMLLAGLFALPILYLAFTREERSKKVIAGTKALTIVLLALAAASPSITLQQSMQEEAEAVILEDSSRSMNAVNDAELDLEGLSTSTRTIAAGNSSELKTGILENVERNKVYLLHSDLQSSSSLEGVAQAVRRRNSTIHVLKSDEKEDASVTVEGPETTYPGAENTYSVKVDSTGEIPKPELYMDESKVELEKVSEGEWEFTTTLPEKGYYNLYASINSNDRFEENNEYFHSVKVTERPEILVLGNEGRIGQEFDDFYSFKYRNSLPEDLSDYYAVIAKKDFEEADLSTYTAEGNGLIYTGDYEDENSLLPVKQVDQEKQSEGAKIVIVVDISIGAGTCATETCWAEQKDQADVKKSKEIAYTLVHEETGLAYNNKVGVIAYNDQAHKVSDIKSLSENREELKDKISRLDPEGPSLHHTGLRGAKKLLNGTGNIIMITDGEETGYGNSVNTMQKSRETASSLDVKLITVGVRQNVNDNFLRDLARRGGGQFFNAEDSNRIQFMFAGGGTESRAEGLYVVDKNHFVTRNIETEGSITGFDTVEPRKGARLLVASENGKPFLTTWRYGLGRVAAFSGGTKDLGRAMYRDSGLVSNTLSWAVGEPERKKDDWMNIENSFQGQEVEVRSSNEMEGLNRQGEELYTKTLQPDQNGFHSFKDAVYSYNYNPEIEKVGYSNVKEFASLTGGEVFEPGQEEEIKDAIRQFNMREVNSQQNLAGLFLAAALLVFLSEVGYRKRKGKK